MPLMNVPWPACWSSRPRGRRRVRPRRPTARRSSGRATAVDDAVPGSQGCSAWASNVRSPVSRTSTWGADDRRWQAAPGGGGRERAATVEATRPAGQAWRARRPVSPTSPKCRADAVGEVHVVRADGVPLGADAAPPAGGSPSCPIARPTGGCGRPGAGRARRCRSPAAVASPSPSTSRRRRARALARRERVVRELDHDRVRSHEAHRPGRVGGHGDAAAASSGCNAPSGPSKSRRSPRRQRLKTMPRSGYR